MDYFPQKMSTDTSLILLTFEMIGFVLLPKLCCMQEISTICLVNTASKSLLSLSESIGFDPLKYSLGSESK